jgi:RNA polymerase sigma factor (sigma-70 family)
MTAGARLGAVSESSSLTTLVANASRGERAAEAELLRRFVPAVRAFARRRLRGADAVEEFAQDVLLVLIEALRRGTVQEPERLGGYVLGICRNLAHDRALQRERRRALLESYGAALAPWDHAAMAQRSVYELAHLEDCLSQLSGKAREVVRLSYIESRAHSEIAATLAISESNARVLRHRTLGALRECMSKRISWEAA